jgi:putative ABC transport system permease protein
MDLAVRSADPGSLPAAVRQALQGVDPELPLSHVRTMDDALTRSMEPRTFNVALLGTFAGVALVLCIVGLYGMVSYSVAQRTREIGVRVALGAQPSEVVRLVMSTGGRTVAAGIAAGLVCALAMGRLLQDLLYSVRPADPVTLFCAAAILAAAGCIAAFIPARRATRLDPVAALRAE